MTEKKTFKDSEGVLVYENRHAPENSGYWCFAGKMFPTDEWDMEVTFTKKAKPIQINSVVKDLMGNTGRVVAVQADKVWVNYYLDDNGRAVDFDCVEWLSELTNVS